MREFDSITGNAEFKQDINYKYLEAKVFQNLIEFIHEFSRDNENSDALDFMRISYKRNVGDVVTIKNYVGLIHLSNGYQIQVLPKISFASGEDTGNKQTKKILSEDAQEHEGLPK